VTVTNLLPHNSNLNSFTVLVPSRRCKGTWVNVKTVTAKVSVVAELEISLEVVMITPSRKAIGVLKIKWVLAG